MKIIINFKHFYRSFALESKYQFLIIKLFNFLKSIQNFDGPSFLITNNITVPIKKYNSFI
jgi:hypothetical protein